MFRNNILLFVFLMGWNILPAQSVSLDVLSEDLGTFQKHYVYPSILRALIGQQDDSFNHLIEDIDFVRIVNIDSTYISKNNELFIELRSDLANEGFESIASMQEKESTNEFFVLEKNEQIEGFLLYRKQAYSYMLIEIVGDIQLGKLNDLMNIDYDNFSILME